MTASVMMPTLSAEDPRAVKRTTLPGAMPGKLYFAQVREDPLLEIEYLAPAGNETIVVVGSGGCTALSLLAAGAGKVVAVDSNPTQTNVIELKAAAITALGVAEAGAFLGASPMDGRKRLRISSTLGRFMTRRAVGWCNDNPGAIECGVLGAGVSERFIRVVARIVSAGVHPRDRIDRLLACTTLDGQRVIYRNEWNNRRWRLMFDLVLNRWVFNRAYDPAFFANVENPGFAAHFRQLMEHALCEIPVSTNYFLHHMLTGAYPAGIAGGVPPYLDTANEATIRLNAPGLELVDGRYEDYLATCADDSVDGFALSNICEWLTAREVPGLFDQVVRVAKPGARVCFRNFVGHTVIPARLKDVLVEDVGRGIAAIRRDRSCLQARIAMCTVEK